jgi:AhpC/TSA family
VSVFEVSVILLWVLLLVVMVLLVAVVKRLGEHQRQLAGFLPAEGLKAGERAPATTVTTVDGVGVTWGEAGAGTMVLGFFSAHCRACGEQVPLFNAVAGSAQEQGVGALAVIDGGTDDAAHLLAAIEPPVRAVLAPFGESPLLADLRVSTFPSYLVIAGDGTVLATAGTAPDVATALGLDATAPAGH